MSFFTDLQNDSWTALLMVSGTEWIVQALVECFRGVTSCNCHGLLDLLELLIEKGLNTFVPQCLDLLLDIADQHHKVIDDSLHVHHVISSSLHMGMNLKLQLVEFLISINKFHLGTMNAISNALE